jgi:hypothetical protein
MQEVSPGRVGKARHHALLEYLVPGGACFQRLPDFIHVTVVGYLARGQNACNHDPSRGQGQPKSGLEGPGAFDSIAKDTFQSLFSPCFLRAYTPTA